MSSPTRNQAWAHDAAARITTEKRTILGVTQTISYSHNLDGSIASITYPSTNRVNYTVSNARRLTAAKDAATQFVYGASYAAPGGLSALIAGQVSGGFTGVQETHNYSQSLEYTATKATSTAGTAMDLTLNYTPAASDNGSVTSITNNQAPSPVHAPIRAVLRNRFFGQHSVVVYR
jgi:hypothetical protein